MKKLETIICNGGMQMKHNSKILCLYNLHQEVSCQHLYDDRECLYRTTSQVKRDNKVCLYEKK